MYSQKGNTILIVILIAAAVAGAAYFGYQLMSKGGVKTPPPSATTKATPVNLEEGKRLPPAQVTITKNGFVPATIEVKAGQGVTFINEDTISHKLQSDSKNPDDSLADIDPIAVKERMIFSFSSPDTIHISDPQNSSLKLTVIVK